MMVETAAPAIAESGTSRRRGVHQPILTVIVPTKNEAGNIEPLLRRVQDSVGGHATEVIFVDDSNDGTADVISGMADAFMLSVRLVHRPPEQRADGLGGAVVEGIRAAQGDWVCVMDADLQHPPEVIPELLRRARGESVDLVIASRFVPTAELGGMNPLRVLMSLLTRLSAQLLFPQRLSRVADPLSGFFLFRRRSVDPNQLRPRGFKILLEILVRFPELTVAEVPFQFQPRHSGTSKADTREGLRYYRLLLDLRLQRLQRLFSFGLVGISGLVVNQLLLALFAEVVGVHYLVAAVIATQGSTGWNFILTDEWVFRDRAASRSTLVRFIQSALMNNLLLVARGPLLVLLTSGLGMHYLTSNLVTLIAFTVFRFAVADRWIWGEQATKRTFNYDIHGILRISSEAPLPELAYFRSSEVFVDEPNLRVRVGSPSRRSKVARVDGFFQYREVLGRLGFWVEITSGECTEVIVGPLLRFSPHVLYTNVVEPILRWMLVRRGYALMHGACLTRGGEAMLLTARTDTGKTSTLLRLLAGQRLGFLSDDMVILRPDGEVLCYPKPLTISAHTLGAVSELATLSRLERLMLPLQSRVHSRSGRLFAKLLARMPLPVATINTLVQMIIPPPKYAIGRLVPSVELCHTSRIARRFEIQRGPDLEEAIEPQLAHVMALDDCEDAYGFPPYAEMEPFLTTCWGSDLRPEEEQIISEGLGGRPTTLIRREARDWSARIGEIYRQSPAPLEHMHPDGDSSISLGAA